MRLRLFTRPPRVVAFDLSLTATGYAGPGAGSGVLRTTLTGVDRLRYLRDGIVAIAAIAELVVIEGYAFGVKNQRGVHSTAELRGAVTLALSEKNKAIAVVPPACLKLFATGKGNAKKSVVLAAAREKLGYTGKDDNEADALWLLAMGRASYASTPLPDHAERALDGCEWPVDALVDIAAANRAAERQA